MSEEHSIQWVEVPAIPCDECGGTGSHWPKRADGQFDRRFLYPTGPCLQCHIACAEVISGVQKP